MTMGAALEILIVPTLLITLVTVLLLKAGLSTPCLVAMGVFMGLLYFVIIKLLRQMRRYDQLSEAYERKERERAEREAEGHA
jgi:hypothetical protein